MRNHFTTLSYRKLKQEQIRLKRLLLINWIAMVTVLLTPLTVSACASAQPTQTAAPVVNNAANTAAITVNSPVAQPPTATQETVVATVNGKPITLAVLTKEVNRKIEGIKAVGDPLPTDMKAYRELTLDGLIDQFLIEDAAAAQKITVTPEEVEKEYQENLKIAGSKEKLAAQIASDRLTEAEYRVGLRSALLTGKMRDIVTAGAPTTSEQVHARHILVSTEATAKDVVGRLKSGIDFAVVAAQFSLDASTRDGGGDLGWFAKGDLLEPSVEEAAFALQLNEISAPIKSSLGYHIVQTLERVKERPLSPEAQVKQASRLFDTWLQGLRKNAKIEKFLDKLG